MRLIVTTCRNARANTQFFVALNQHVYKLTHSEEQWNSWLDVISTKPSSKARTYFTSSRKQTTTMANRVLFQTYADIDRELRASSCEDDTGAILGACAHLEEAYREHSERTNRTVLLASPLLRVWAMNEALWLFGLNQDEASCDVSLARKIGSLRQPPRDPRQHVNLISDAVDFLNHDGLVEPFKSRNRLVFASELAKRAFCWWSIGDNSFAIKDCENGLQSLISCPNEVALLPRLILQSILAISKCGHLDFRPTSRSWTRG